MKLDSISDNVALNGVMYHDNSALQTIKHSSDPQQALETVAGQFEAMFLQMVLRQMRSSSDVLADKDSPFSSKNQGVFRDMFDGQLAIEMSGKQQAGIAEMLVKQLGPASPESNVTPLRRTNHQPRPEATSQLQGVDTALQSSPVNPTGQVVALTNNTLQQVGNSSAFAQPLIRTMERETL
ncbi:rod-binding protein [Vibrio sp.]|uniref:rod-binding protein n=1 Tax=Vibrio sp. TaxID=678 RepID=UPI003D0A5445